MVLWSIKNIFCSLKNLKNTFCLWLFFKLWTLKTKEHRHHSWNSSQNLVTLKSKSSHIQGCTISQKKQSPGHYITWVLRFLWPGWTYFINFWVIWNPWISSLIVGMIVSSPLGSECAAQNVEVNWIRPAQLIKPEMWVLCEYGCFTKC